MGSITIRGRMAQIRPHNRSATRYTDGYQRDLQIKKIEMERMRRSLELLYTDRHRARYYRPPSRQHHYDYDPEERHRYESLYGDRYGYRLREQYHHRSRMPPTAADLDPPTAADLDSDEIRKNLKWQEIKLRARLASIQEELSKGPRINPNNSSLDDVQPIHEFVPSREPSSISTHSDEDHLYPREDNSSNSDGEKSRSLLILVKDDIKPSANASDEQKDENSNENAAN